VRLQRRQRGVALVVVLWILLLVTISTGTYTLMARMDTLEAHTVLSGTQARLGAEAGINFAVLSLQDPNIEARLIPDGRSYFVDYRGMEIEVQVTDERGKVNINRAGEQTLVQLFTGHGLDEGDAVMLAAAVADWVDGDEATRVEGAELPEYEAAGLAVGPANRPFVITEEVLQVIGMPFELYEKMKPGLTVFSDAGQPDAAFAPVEALLALPDMTPEDALNLVEQRHSQESLDGTQITLPGGQTVMARGRGVTYSILAKATLPNGVWDQVEATVRMGRGSDGITPYSVLRWREGFHN
jgi:general secretion pathway protein K